MSGRQEASVSEIMKLQTKASKRGKGPNPRDKAAKKFQPPMAQWRVAQPWSLMLPASMGLEVWELVLFILAPPQPATESGFPEIFSFLRDEKSGRPLRCREKNGPAMRARILGR